MKHTKNILKSLLITVMALSLLAVSCSKDESKPTSPATINLFAEAKKAVAAAETAAKEAEAAVSGLASDTAEADDSVKQKVTSAVDTANKAVTAVKALGITSNDTKIKEVENAVKAINEKADFKKSTLSPLVTALKNSVTSLKSITVL